MFDDDAVVDIQNEPCAQYGPGNSENDELELESETEELETEDEETEDLDDEEMEESEDLEEVDGAALLRQVEKFIGRYLHCSEHQRAILALWVLHTYCLGGAQVSPFLFIQSLEKQSGKTLCLQLLKLLCRLPVLTVGGNASTLTRRLEFGGTLLLDECQASFGTRNRAKAPALRAILASGFHRGLGYSGQDSERSLFGPKAFAGRGPLPEDLADRSISIVLKPILRNQFGLTRERIDRFRPAQTRIKAEADSLRRDLSSWSKIYVPILQDWPAHFQFQDQFLAGLSPRQQDLFEPLLQLAYLLGEEWPARMRKAGEAVFVEQADTDMEPALQMLEDMHRCFAFHGDLARMKTAHVLQFLNGLPNRLWAQSCDGPLTGRTLAQLLMKFDIFPRVQRDETKNPARGYLMSDIEAAWKMNCKDRFAAEYKMSKKNEDKREFAPWSETEAEPRIEAALPEATAKSESITSEKQLVTDDQNSEIAGNDAACNAVTHARANDVAAPENWDVDAARIGSESEPQSSTAASNCGSRLTVRSTPQFG